MSRNSKRSKRSRSVPRPQKPQAKASTSSAPLIIEDEFDAVTDHGASLANKTHLYGTGDRGVSTDTLSNPEGLKRESEIDYQKIFAIVGSVLAVVVPVAGVTYYISQIEKDVSNLDQKSQLFQSITNENMVTLRKRVDNVSSDVRDLREFRIRLEEREAHKHDSNSPKNENK